MGGRPRPLTAALGTAWRETKLVGAIVGLVVLIAIVLLVPLLLGRL